MKIAKYVVIGQVVLSVVLLVVFATRSGASSGARGRVEDRRAHAVDREMDREADDSHAGHDDGEAPKRGGKSARVARGEVRDEDDFKVDYQEPGKAGKGDEPAAKPRDKAHGKDADGKATALGVDPRTVAQTLLAGNARFVEGHRSGFDLVNQRESTATTQRPGVMVLGCADSRVPPEIIFDRGVGEMFVVRSAGNIAEPVAVGSLEYAAEHLHTKVLLVLGHEKCGAVQAALAESKMPSPNLEAVVANILPAVRELKAWVDGDQLLRMAVEANVRRQAEEVMRKSPLLRAAVARKELTVLKAVYDITTGHVRPL